MPRCKRYTCLETSLVITMHLQENKTSHLLSAASISSTMSQSTRASGDEAPYFFEASRASLTASELSTRSERAVARRCWEIMLAGAKADVDATKREVRRSFIVICLFVVCLFGCDVYRRSFL